MINAFCGLGLAKDSNLDVCKLLVDIGWRREAQEVQEEEAHETAVTKERASYIC